MRRTVKVIVAIRGGPVLSGKKKSATDLTSTAEIGVGPRMK